MNNNYESVNIFGLKVQRVTIQDIIEEVKYAIYNQNTFTTTSLNPHRINQVFENRSLIEIYNQIDIVTPDSIGTIWAAKMIGSPLMSERINGNVLAPYLYEISKKLDFRFYFLGGAEGVAKEAAEKLIRVYPWLKIVGMHNGYFNQEKNIRIIEKINGLCPNIIFVGLGSPLEEKWIIENASKLKPTVLVSVGGYFDHVIRRVDCYPKWINDLKINWLYRLYKEPRRLWKRYLIGNPLFLWRVLKSRMVGI